MRCQASPAPHNLEELSLCWDPDVRHVFAGKGGEWSREGEVGRGDEEEEKKEDKRDIGRGVGTGERQRKINKRKAKKN